MLLHTLEKEKLVSSPKWLSDNTSYLTMMGSQAYGVNNKDSDFDVYGFCIPPKGVIFPNTNGVIFGFGDQGERFEQWQQHHIKFNEKEYDFSIYSIVKYFQLCMDNNPNMLDSLFTATNCVMHGTHISELVRENRRLFLHKGAYHKYKGYAYAQRSKINQKSNSSNPKRAQTIVDFGYDIKFAYHLVRLLNECEQILMEGDLDLFRNREQLKSIRRGEWSLEQIDQYFVDKEKSLEELYVSSTLQHTPDEKVLKNLLLNCLEHHYGSLTEVVKREDNGDTILKELQELVKRFTQ